MRRERQLQRKTEVEKEKKRMKINEKWDQKTLSEEKMRMKGERRQIVKMKGHEYFAAGVQEL